MPANRRPSSERSVQSPRFTTIVVSLRCPSCGARIAISTSMPRKYTILNARFIENPISSSVICLRRKSHILAVGLLNIVTEPLVGCADEDG
jgi:hypothetical protein